MPVPSPQQIQYMNAFEGQELTIQKQPNTGASGSGINKDLSVDRFPSGGPAGNASQFPVPSSPQQQHQQQVVNGPSKCGENNSQLSYLFFNNISDDKQQRLTGVEFPKSPGGGGVGGVASNFASHHMKMEVCF